MGAAVEVQRRCGRHDGVLACQKSTLAALIYIKAVLRLVDLIANIAKLKSEALPSIIH
jgi:hypothetical protein